MRLICPNCGAQYEVPESVIPENGRDVQCSSCGNTWFQHHPMYANATEDEDEFDEVEPEWDDDGPTQNADDDPFADSDEDQPEPEFDTQVAPAPASRTANDADDDNFDDDSTDDEWQGFPSDPGLSETPKNTNRLVPDPDDPVSRLPEVEEDDYEEDPARDLPMPRRSLDTSVADMLREEAEREARARAAERGSGLESQPDLGLDSGPATPRPTPPQRDNETLRRRDEETARTARLRTEQPAAAASKPAQAELPRQNIPPSQNATPVRDTVSDDTKIAVAAAVADSRRALLPDIEEINSSLRSTSDRRPARADDHERPGGGTTVTPAQNTRPRGFSRGFSITPLIAMILLALYVFAPAIIDAMPGLAPVMEAYISAVDALRIALDAQVQNLSRWLAEIAGSTA